MTEPNAAAVRWWRYPCCPPGVLVAVVAVLLASACLGDDSSAASEADDSTTTSRPTTTEARRQTPSVEQEISRLLRRYDDVTAEIAADPAIAANRDDPLYDELEALLVPGTEMAQGVIDTFVQEGQRGGYQLPVEGEARPVERRLDGRVRLDSEDEASFPVCVLLQYREFDAQGRQWRILPGLVEPGVGHAVRIRGEWQLPHIEADDRAYCPGGGT